MRAKLNGHAPETEEIFPPLRPAHDHQKGAQIMGKIQPPYASRHGGAGVCNSILFYFNSALTFFEILLNPICPLLNPSQGQTWSGYSVLNQGTVP